MARPRSEKPYVTGPEKHRQRWRVRIHRRRDDGTRETRIRSFAAEAEARAFVRAFRVVATSDARTVGQAIEDYVSARRAAGNKERSLVTARYRLVRLLPDGMPLTDLRPHRAQARYWALYHARRLMREAGIPEVSLHGLRGTHATLATVEGVTGEAVARAVGHTSPKITREHYLDGDTTADAQAGRAAGVLVRKR